jgi:hypothetical protein
MSEPRAPVGIKGGLRQTGNEDKILIKPQGVD